MRVKRIFLWGAVAMVIVATALLLYRTTQRSYCPEVARTTEFHLPTYPHVLQQKSNIRMAGLDTVTELSFQTNRPPQDVIDFYKQRLEADHWRLYENNNNAFLVFTEESALPIYSLQLRIEPVDNQVSEVNITFVSGQCTLR